MKKLLIGIIALVVCLLVVSGVKGIGFDTDEEAPQRVITITRPDGTVTTIPMIVMDESDVYGGTYYAHRKKSPVFPS